MKKIPDLNRALFDDNVSQIVLFGELTFSSDTKHKHIVKIEETYRKDELISMEIVDISDRLPK
ncbi:MAG: hypothetical protein A2252_01520 [Elusimicrobia bacterium RIFOXYA2_FULL_39_19]|nr:MAG: hypothetical protein A2252_01520 [Elusimicrobia bacterium RIFOXYA2_FULL_39_19]